MHTSSKLHPDWFEIIFVGCVIVFGLSTYNQLRRLRISNEASMVALRLTVNQGIRYLARISGSLQRADGSVGLVRQQPTSAGPQSVGGTDKKPSAQEAGVAKVWIERVE